MPNHRATHLVDVEASIDAVLFYHTSLAFKLQHFPNRESSLQGTNPLKYSEVIKNAKRFPSSRHTPSVISISRAFLTISTALISTSPSPIVGNLQIKTFHSSSPSSTLLVESEPRIFDSEARLLHPSLCIRAAEDSEAAQCKGSVFQIATIRFQITPLSFPILRISRYGVTVRLSIFGMCCCGAYARMRTRSYGRRRCCFGAEMTSKVNTNLRLDFVMQNLSTGFR